VNASIIFWEKALAYQFSMHRQGKLLQNPFDIYLHTWPGGVDMIP